MKTALILTAMYFSLTASAGTVVESLYTCTRNGLRDQVGVILNDGPGFRLIATKSKPGIVKVLDAQVFGKTVGGILVFEDTQATIRLRIKKEEGILFGELVALADGPGGFIKKDFVCFKNREFYVP